MEFMMADGTTSSISYNNDDLAYFAEQLRKSGKFEVKDLTSTPKNTRSVTFEVTPTPIREYNIGLGSRPPPVPNRLHNPSSSISNPPCPVTDGLKSPVWSGIYPATHTRQDRGLYPTIPPPPSYLSYNSQYHSGTPRVPDLPSFSGDEKSLNQYEVWRHDVNCLVTESIYPMQTIREAMRKSLKGAARGALLHLGEFATVQEILNALDGIFGNVRSTEKLKEQFYSECQKEGESITEYSLRLERLLSRVPGIIDRLSRDEMLKNRLWSGLRDTELRNMSRYKFEKDIDFNRLRRELRSMEEDLKFSTKINRSQQKVNIPTQPEIVEIPSPSPKVEAQCFSANVECKVLEQLKQLTDQMSNMQTRLGSLETDLKEYKESSDGRQWSWGGDSGNRWNNRGNSNRWNHRGNYNRNSNRWNDREDRNRDKDKDKEKEKKSDHEQKETNSDKEDLNSDGPPS